jgi:hypothetical protein
MPEKCAGKKWPRCNNHHIIGSLKYQAKQAAKQRKQPAPGSFLYRQPLLLYDTLSLISREKCCRFSPCTKVNFKQSLSHSDPLSMYRRRREKMVNQGYEILEI